MSMQQAEVFNEAERQLLNRILDQLVPASADGRIPSAGALGVTDFLATRVTDDQELAALFRQGLVAATTLADSAGNAVSEVDDQQWQMLVATLEREESEFFDALLRHTYMGYYTDPTVRPLFGLSAKPTQPEGYAVPADDPDELKSLLDPVVRRGECYRTC